MNHGLLNWPYLNELLAPIVSFDLDRAQVRPYLFDANRYDLSDKMACGNSTNRICRKMLTVAIVVCKVSADIGNVLAIDSANPYQRIWRYGA